MTGDPVDLTASPTKNEEISNIKPFRGDEINVKKSNGRSKRQLTVDMLPSVTQNVYVIEKQHVFRNSRPQPTILQLAKLNYNGIRRRPFLTRQELLKDKLLSQELGARLAEAKLTLLGPEAVLEEADKRTRAKKRRSDKRHQPAHHVSFLSVSKRVTNIIRFRQAAQGQTTGSGIAKENSTLEAAENLPKTPRFSSYMSAAAQYALMKGYEDIIFEKLSSKYPDCTTSLKRNKTPHHGIAISDKSTFAEKLKNLNSINWSNLNDDNDAQFSTNSVRKRDKKESEENSAKITSDVRPEQKKLHQDALNRPALNSQLYSQIVAENETSDSITVAKSSNSFLPNIATGSQTLLRKSEHSTQCLPSYARRTSILSTQNFPEIARMTSPDALRRDRRIVLSYRIENAMDILDTIKTKSEQALSPRVKCQPHRPIAPLRDFNRWTDQWATEFNSDIVK
ncbi:hypothetical protein BsWGS_17644 [Bradybaena similaris]